LEGSERADLDVGARDGAPLTGVSSEGAEESDVPDAEAVSDLFSRPSGRDWVILKTPSCVVCWSLFCCLESTLNISFTLAQLYEKTAK